MHSAERTAAVSDKCCRDALNTDSFHKINVAFHNQSSVGLAVGSTPSTIQALKAFARSTLFQMEQALTIESSLRNGTKKT